MEKDRRHKQYSTAPVLGREKRNNTSTYKYTNAPLKKKTDQAQGGGLTKRNETTRNNMLSYPIVPRSPRRASNISHIYTSRSLQATTGTHVLSGTARQKQTAGREGGREGQKQNQKQSLKQTRVGAHCFILPSNSYQLRSELLLEASRDTGTVRLLGPQSHLLPQPPPADCTGLPRRCRPRSSLLARRLR